MQHCSRICVKEILMIPTPIVIFLFALLCSFVWFSSSRFRRSYFKFAAICRHFFRAFLGLDPSRIFQALPFGSRLFFRNILSNILEALDRLLSVRHFVLPRTHVAPGIIDNFIYLAHIRDFFTNFVTKKVSPALDPAFDRVFPTFYPVRYRFYYVISR